MRRLPQVNQTILDRLVAWYDPEKGARRAKARITLSLVTGDTGYKGGRRDRRATRNWRPQGGSADADISPDLPDLRARSRDLARNNMIAGGAISTVTTNVVGNGLSVMPAIDQSVLGLDDDAAHAWQLQAAREFALWAQNADATGVQTFGEMQELAFRSVLESGDAFVLRRYRRTARTAYRTRIQMIEADRICNPNRMADTDRLVDGIDLARDGRHLGYHVASRHPGAVHRAALTWTRIPARLDAATPIMLHLFQRLRPDQTRGVPYVAPVIEALKQFGDYTDAEVTAAVISSMFTVFITSDGDPDASPFKDENGGNGSASDDREVSLGNGAVVPLADGEDVTFASPTRPNAAFNAFAEAFLSHVGVALELPFELLVQRFTASYSASRAALEMAWSFFRKRRTWLAQRFCQPVYEMVLEEAVARGRIDAPGFLDERRPEIRAAWCGAEWIGPVRPYLDPLKEAKADEVDIANRVKTRREVIIERTGGTYEAKHRQLTRETRDGAALAPAAPPAGADDVPPTNEPDEDPEE